MSAVPTADALLAEASAATGLTDFGDPSFRTGLDRLLASVAQDSIFSESGAAAFRGALVQRLVTRLEVEDWYRRHPEIDAEGIADPVFIVGLPRTGSTALGHMMALDPDTRTLRSWEAAKPCPPPEIGAALTDPRIARNAAREQAFEAVAPGVREALPRNPSAPTECFTLLELSFGSAAEEGFLLCRDFNQWVTTENREELFAAYRYHRRVLKLLQWRHPARRWVLRAPIHAFAMEPLLAAYPDARFLMTHRDPAKVLPSSCSLIAEVRKLFLQERGAAAMGPEATRSWAMALERLVAFRDRIGEARFHDIAHGAQIRDPVGTVRDVYAALGWAFDDAAAQRIAAWREAYPKGSHHPDAGDFGIDPALVEACFARYRERFGALL